MSGNWIVALAMFGWIPFVAIVFMLMKPLRAVLFCYFAGWLFLPVARFDELGLPVYSKDSAVPLVIFAAIAVFDSRQLFALRPKLVDLPMAAYCIAPAISSFTNDLGWYDAASAFVARVLPWGLPWLTGRMYVTSPEGRERLARALLLAGLVYAPLCLWEIRMSPQLHVNLYGFSQHGFSSVLRGGGYRPMVFMHHGLMVSLFMAAATLVGLAYWTSGAAKRIWGLPLWLVTPVLFAVTVLCKSFGALVLLVTGMLTLLSMRSLRFSLPMALTLCLPIAWVGARMSGGWSSREMAAITAELPDQRADSLGYRIRVEDVVVEKTMEKPIFGWGGWDRGVPAWATPGGGGRSLATDSLWICSFGKNGLVGVISVLLIFAVPVIVLWRRVPPRLWATHPGAAVAWVLALVLTNQAVDNLFNDMENPIYLLIAGGLAGLPARRSTAAERPAVRAALPAGPALRTIPPRVPAR